MEKRGDPATHSVRSGWRSFAESPHPHTGLFLYVLIPKGFKFNEFVSVDSGGVAGAFFVSVDSGGVSGAGATFHDLV
jgi:hypothetical protein